MGAYPKGCRYDEPRPERVDYEQAVKDIAKVSLPKADPVYGAKGPLMRLWGKR